MEGGIAIRDYEIQENNLNWRDSGWYKLNKNRVDAIALHHMAHPTAGMQTIHGWHLNRWSGEPGFAYNYFVTLKGEIIKGRGHYRGAHVRNRNSITVGIGFQGNYHPISGASHREKIPDAQFNAGVWLIKYLKENEYPNVKTVDQHNHFQSDTACAGKFFPLSEMLDLKFREGANEMEISFIGEIISDGLNVREKPTISSKKVGRYDRGDRVQIIGKTGNEPYVWLKTKDGYVSNARGEYVKKIVKWHGKVLSDTLNIRNKPTMDGERTGQLTKDEIVDVYAVHGGEWKWLEIGEGEFISNKDNAYVEKVEGRGEKFMLQDAILIGSSDDEPSAKRLARRIKAPIYHRGLEDHIVAKTLFVVGGPDPDNSHVDEIISLSGKTYFKTAEKVAEYLEG